MKQKRFKLEYKDSIDMRCIQIIYGKSEKKAIQNFQVELLTQDDYMTQLIDIEEVPEDTVFVDNKSPEWTLEDGTELDQESQNALNDAMLNMVNEDGMTLKQVWDKEIEDNKNK
tara:strand:+ start:102 stop:443 length:342 start_codon:yes stop_codon:yes gene_type:complete